MTPSPLLVAFAGLPGTGKTTLARAIAHRRRAVLLRVDTIEHAIRDAEVPGLDGDGIGPAGQLVGYALASANAAVVEVEVVCPDIAEHRRRVEQRACDIAGFTPPAWRDVLSLAYEAGDRDRIVVDTAQFNIAEASAQLERSVAERATVNRR